ncbi:imidazole glycerol phosphate synthase subunit HisH [Gammaproteobacteria bacterium]|nr:imidazole glycerol phosphate synthase subunit HisH [Gammaproteobacteria bacterium]MDA8798636.1 imidazole glycerol phosphate synthase subunit HisH [Gammaproteobacteria bacterium]MDC0919298.1 imidazole glycerol phosphate synthase subunit HisH [Gammaproteobacteria bacterium]
MTVGIVDYGVGNLGSVFRAIELIDQKAKIIQQPSELASVTKVILPGVGNFTDCKNSLDSSGWSDALKANVIDLGLPMLGICVGMQLLADSSSEGALNEGQTPGLGFISGSVQSLKDLGCEERVPHMGWNSVSSSNKDNLFKDIPDNTDFYFVHSYAFVPKSDESIQAITNHGIEIVASVQQDNICGTQFHPEKSSKAGLKVIKNFLDCSKW